MGSYGVWADEMNEEHGGAAQKGGSPGDPARAFGGGGQKRRGTKRRGTKRRGTKRRGTKRRGAKRRGTKRRGAKRR